MSVGTEKTNLEKEVEEVIFNQSARAEATLETVLHEDTPEEIIERELSTASVEDEKRSKQILKHETRRVMSRVLFITKDKSYLEKGSSAVTTLLNLAPFFDEIHIMVLVPLGGKDETNRIVDNIWVYRASAQFWWWLPFAAVEKAKEQFAFSEGFRPDLIIGLDPFESGLAALNIAKKFNRPFQVHVSDDFLNNSYVKQNEGNNWRRKIAKYVLKRSKSVRTSSAGIKNSIKTKFKHIEDLEILPQFRNYSAFLDARPSFNVHEKYKDFVFVALAFGPLSADSHLHDTFTALNSVLHNPRIGLIVIGSGPGKKLFEDKVKLLGIEKNVVFLQKVDDITSYLKTSDVLIQTDTSKESEDIVLKAAASGLPMIMYETETRKDLFEDGKSATICEKGDIHAIENYMTAFLNNTGLRLQYKDAGRHVIRTRLNEDETTYYRAFRDSIEIALNNRTEDNENDK